MEISLRNIIYGGFICLVYTIGVSMAFSQLISFVLSHFQASAVLARPLAYLADGLFNFGILSLPGGFICGWYIGRKIDVDIILNALFASCMGSAMYLILSIVLARRLSEAFIVYYAIPVSFGFVLGSFLGAKKKEIDYRAP